MAKEQNTTIEYLFADENDVAVENEDWYETGLVTGKEKNLRDIARRMYPSAFRPEYVNMSNDEREARNQKLVAAIQNGVSAAFEELVNVNMPKLLKAATRNYFRFHLNLYDFEDVLEHAIEVLLDCAYNYNAEAGPFFNYFCSCLFKNMRGYCISTYQAYYDHDSLDAEMYDDEGNKTTLLDKLADTCAVDEDDEYEEDVLKGAQIREVVKTLPAKQQVVFSLVHGLSGEAPMKHYEVAVRLGISRQTEHKYYESARKMIWEHMNPAG